MHIRVFNVLASLDEPLAILQGKQSFCNESDPAERDPIQTNFLGTITMLRTTSLIRIFGNLKV